MKYKIKNFDILKFRVRFKEINVETLGWIPQTQRLEDSDEK